MNELFDQLLQRFQAGMENAVVWANSPQFYLQLGVIAVATVTAFVIASACRKLIPIFARSPGAGQFLRLRTILHRTQVLIFPLLLVLLLGVGTSIAEANETPAWLILAARSVAFVMLLSTAIANFIESRFVRSMTMWVGVPIATLHVFGLLTPLANYLDSVALTVGDIHLTLYAFLRTAIFGTALFWMGRASNVAGKQAIRNQQNLDSGTREVFAKLFEIALFVIVFLLLLQVMGINLTALAVFGGALGVGLGFGLQQIASNFVSGIIILLDRSVTIGDFIELEDGRSGTLRELNMRFGVIETYDGKDVMIPNETFITTSYTNWTHKDPRQRYPLNFQVAYSTDLDKLFDNIRQICNEHPTVISGDDLPVEIRPDAEIAGFGDSGIDILVEFWIEGIDDGENRVGADLMHSIWRSIQENGMEIPFPQREVRILNEGDSGGI